MSAGSDEIDRCVLAMHTGRSPNPASVYRSIWRAAAGLYDEVLLNRGDATRHYALTNPKEFFAEMSECYFGTNDFYPFVRKELELHDPETLRLLEEIWGEVP